MATASQLIEEALAQLGIKAAGEEVQGDDLAHGLTTLNTMIDSWNLPGPIAYATNDATATLTTGSTSLTIGPAQQINVTRPVRIDAGSYARVDGVDWPMEQVGEAEYNRIWLKTQTAHVPSIFYYEAGASTGTIKYWPAPGQSCVVHHPVIAQFSQFADLTTNYVFPQGYKRTLVFNLAIELAPTYEKMPSALVLRTAAAMLRNVKRANLTVPQLETGPGGETLLGEWWQRY